MDALLSALPLLLLVLCPLMMLFMMRGMNHGGHDKGHVDHSSPPVPVTADELRALRADLDARLEELDGRTGGAETNGIPRAKARTPRAVVSSPMDHIHRG